MCVGTELFCAAPCCCLLTPCWPLSPHPFPPYKQDLLVHCEQQVMRFVMRYLHSTLVEQQDVEDICQQVRSQRHASHEVPPASPPPRPFAWVVAANR